MKNLCVIPARGGSKRIPGKNIKEFHGKPVIAYSIEAALGTQLFDQVVVSTDSREIAEISAQFGADILLRPEKLSDDLTGTYEVIRHAYKSYESFNYQNICCIYATSPMISQFDISRGYMAVQYSRNFHAISVGYPPLEDAAQFYWSRCEAIRLGLGYWEFTTSAIYIDSNRVCDINTPEDWERAEKMYLNLPKEIFIKERN